MKQPKRYQFKKFEPDLHEAVLRSKKFELAYEVEMAKLRMAHKLAELREKMGLSQAELARRMKVSQQLISRIESGSDNLTIETLIRFFDILGVHLKIDVTKRRSNQGILEFA